MHEGAKVHHKYEPNRVGTIVQVMYHRFFVRWDDDGKTWVYPANQLELA